MRDRHHSRRGLHRANRYERASKTVFLFDASVAVPAQSLQRSPTAQTSFLSTPSVSPHRFSGHTPLSYSAATRRSCRSRTSSGQWSLCYCAFLHTRALTFSYSSGILPLHTRAYISNALPALCCASGRCSRALTTCWALSRNHARRHAYPLSRMTFLFIPSPSPSPLPHSSCSGRQPLASASQRPQAACASVTSAVALRFFQRPPAALTTTFLFQEAKKENEKQGNPHR